jgi:hypothetical protein
MKKARGRALRPAPGVCHDAYEEEEVVARKRERRRDGTESTELNEVSRVFG